MVTEDRYTSMLIVNYARFNWQLIYEPAYFFSGVASQLLEQLFIVAWILIIDSSFMLIPTGLPQMIDLLN